MEVGSKWYECVDYAFCELGLASKKIVLVHVLRYVYNHDYSFNQIYQVSFKSIIGCHAEDTFNKIRVVPLFDSYN